MTRPNPTYSTAHDTEIAQDWPHELSKRETKRVRYSPLVPSSFANEPITLKTPNTTLRLVYSGCPYRNVELTLPSSLYVFDDGATTSITWTVAGVAVARKAPDAFVTIASST